MNEQPPLPQPIWDTLSSEAQAAVSVLVQSFERRIADLEERIGKNSTNSSRPPSCDPPSVKRPPPAPASGKKRGGQPGHRRQARPLVPPEQLRRVIDCKPPECRWCHQPLQGDDPEPIRHQVAELPPVQPTVDEYRLHRLVCPRCRTSTRRRPPADPTSGRRTATGPADGGRIPAPSPGVPPLPHLDLCEPAAGRAPRGVRPPTPGDPQRPGRGLPPGQASGPPARLRPPRPDDLRRDDLPTGAAIRRRTGGPGRGTPGVRP